MSDLTTILNALGESRDASDEERFATIYAELRRIAACRMAGERDSHTLQPTALAHEALIRLGDGQWDSRAHFFSAASEAMRRILIECARRRLAARRGGGAAHLPIGESVLGIPAPDAKLLLVHEALDTLAREHPLEAEVVKLRIFAGLAHREVAALLEIGERTARRHWQQAKMRLFEIIREELEPEESG